MHKYSQRINTPCVSLAGCVCSASAPCTASLLSQVSPPSRRTFWHLPPTNCYNRQARQHHASLSFPRLLHTSEKGRLTQVKWISRVAYFLTGSPFSPPAQGFSEQSFVFHLRDTALNRAPPSLGFNFCLFFAKIKCKRKLCLLLVEKPVLLNIDKRQSEK